MDPHKPPKCLKKDLNENEVLRQYVLNKAAAFSRFPVLYDGENIELPKETSAVHSDTGIVLGEDRNEHLARIPFKILPKYMFVCGVPGAGKTNTMLHIANNLWNHELPDLSGCLEWRITMPVSCDKLWKLLIDKKMSCTDLKEAAVISFNVLGKSVCQIIKVSTKCHER